MASISSGSHDDGGTPEKTPNVGVGSPGKFVMHLTPPWLLMLIKYYMNIEAGDEESVEQWAAYMKDQHMIKILLLKLGSPDNLKDVETIEKTVHAIRDVSGGGSLAAASIGRA